MRSKDETNHYLSFGSGPMFWKNVDPELWIIFRWFHMTVLGLLDYLGIDLNILNENSYSNKTNGYKWWTIMYHVRIQIWSQNWSDSAPEFWKNRIISESAWPFQKLFDIFFLNPYFVAISSCMIARCLMFLIFV